LKYTNNPTTPGGRGAALPANDVMYCDVLSFSYRDVYSTEAYVDQIEEI